jgi:hypothetical protein
MDGPRVLRGKSLKRIHIQTHKILGWLFRFCSNLGICYFEKKLLAGWSDMDLPRFEYFALEYFNNWLTDDRKFCDVFAPDIQQKLPSEERAKTLKRILTYYGLARCLPIQADTNPDDRYKTVIKILDDVAPVSPEDDPLPPIEKTGAALSKAFGGKLLPSLTTKLLWLKLKDPFIIFDSRVESTLKPTGKLEGHVKNAGPYEQRLFNYYAEWKVQFEDKKDSIKKASQSLPSMRWYTSDPKYATEDYIADITSQKWFHGRVLDAYLWFKRQPDGIKPA